MGRLTKLTKSVSIGGVDYAWPTVAPSATQVLSAVDSRGALTWQDPPSSSDRADGPENAVQWNLGGKLHGTSDFTFDGTNCEVNGSLQCDSIETKALAVAVSSALPLKTSVGSVPYVWPSVGPRQKQLLAARDDAGTLEWLGISSIPDAGGPEGSVQRSKNGQLYGDADFTYDGTDCQITGSVRTTSVSADTLNVAASSTLAADVTIGSIAYTWPSAGPAVGDILTAATGYQLTWQSATPPATAAGPNNAVQLNNGGDFAGSAALLFDGQTLQVDGDLTASTATISGETATGALTVSGDVQCTGGLFADTASIGSKLLAGEVESQGSLSAVTADISGNTSTGGLTVSGDVQCTGGLTAATATIAAKLLAGEVESQGALSAVTAAISGDASTGDLTVAGDTQCSGQLSGSSAAVSGPTSTGDLTVTGDTQCTGGLTAATATIAAKLLAGEVESQGALSAVTAAISGDASTGDLTVAGDAQCSGQLSGSSAAVSGPTSTGDLTVTGDTQCTGGLTAATATIAAKLLAGEVESQGALSAVTAAISGDASTGDLTVAGDAQCSGQLSGSSAAVSGPTSTGDLTVTGDTQCTGGLTAATATIAAKLLAGEVESQGALSAVTAAISGDTQCAGALSVQGACAFDQDTTVSGVFSIGPTDAAGPAIPMHVNSIRGQYTSINPPTCSAWTGSVNGVSPWGPLVLTAYGNDFAGYIDTTLSGWTDPAGFLGGRVYLTTTLPNISPKNGYTPPGGVPPNPTTLAVVVTTNARATVAGTPASSPVCRAVYNDVDPNDASNTVTVLEIYYTPGAAMTVDYQAFVASERLRLYYFIVQV